MLLIFASSHCKANLFEMAIISLKRLIKTFLFLITTFKLLSLLTAVIYVYALFEAETIEKVFIPNLWNILTVEFWFEPQLQLFLLIFSSLLALFSTFSEHELPFIGSIVVNVFANYVNGDIYDVFFMLAGGEAVLATLLIIVLRR